MSYLILNNGVPGFNKAVISFWFIAPRKSIQKVANRAEAGATGRMSRILPLMTFGQLFEGYRVNSASLGQASYARSLYSFDGATGLYTFISSQNRNYGVGPLLTAGTAVPVDSSYIGVYCDIDEDEGLIAELRIRIQMANLGQASLTDMFNQLNINSHSQLAIATSPNLGSPEQDTACDFSTHTSLTAGVVPGGTMRTHYTNLDYSNVVRGQRGPDAFEAGAGLTIQPDKWHHLLLSFDLSNSANAYGGLIFDDYGNCSPSPNRSKTEPEITSTCKMWIALDDNNHDNSEFEEGVTRRPLGWPSFAHVAMEGLGNNGIVTQDQYELHFIYNDGHYSKSWQVSGLVNIDDKSLAGRPQFTYQPHDVPSSGHAFGFPCVPQAVGHEYHNVELAEFQMWLGKCLDTSVLNHRRAFIDRKKDENGNPVGNLKPVKPSTAEELEIGLDGEEVQSGGARQKMGRPQILLHGTSKWKAGKNTGTLGVNDDGDELLAGQFAPTGEIKKYTPDPELGKPATAPAAMRLARR